MYIYIYIYICYTYVKGIPFFNSFLWGVLSSCSFRGQTKETGSTEIKKPRESLNGTQTTGILLSSLRHPATRESAHPAMGQGCGVCVLQIYEAKQHESSGTISIFCGKRSKPI